VAWPFMPDGSHLLTWDVDYTARWWDVTREKIIHTFEHKRESDWGRCSPQGNACLTWSLDGEAKVWGPRDGENGCGPFEHGEPVSGASFRPGRGSRLDVTGAGFSEWDVKTGKRLRFLKPRFRDYIFESELLRGVVRAEFSVMSRFLLAIPARCPLLGHRPPRGYCRRAANRTRNTPIEVLFHGTFTRIDAGGDASDRRGAFCFITFVRVGAAGIPPRQDGAWLRLQPRRPAPVTWSEMGPPVCGKPVGNRGARRPIARTGGPEWVSSLMSSKPPQR